MKNIIVAFGGAFNPPTNSHFSLAEQIYTEYEEVDKIIFIPVADCYPKEDLLPAVHRVEMLRRVCKKNGHFEVSTIETDAKRLLETIETLKEIQRKHPDHEIWFTMGSDNLKLVPSWKNYKELISTFNFLVLERDDDIMEHIIDASEKLKKYREHFIKVKETVRSNCNSTLLRNKIRRNKSIRYLVPDEVYEYVKEKGLYTVVETT